MKMFLRLNVFAKSLIVALLGIASMVTTYAVTAPIPSPRTKSLADVGPGGTLTKLKGGGQPVPDDPYASEGALGFASTRRIEVETIANVMHLKAMALVRDKRPYQGFVWAIRVVSPQDRETPLFEYWFDTVPTKLNEECEIPLDEIVEIPLPKGNYSLELHLFRVPNGPWPGIRAADWELDLLHAAGGRRPFTID